MNRYQRNRDVVVEHVRRFKTKPSDEEILEGLVRTVRFMSPAPLYWLIQKCTGLGEMNARKLCERFDCNPDEQR